MLEKDLVQQCRELAERAGAFLAVVGQRKAKGSGTTIGYPDLTLIYRGHVKLIELKRPASDEDQKGSLNKGQVWFIDEARKQGVTVHVVYTFNEFAEVLNSCVRKV